MHNFPLHIPCENVLRMDTSQTVRSTEARWCIHDALESAALFLRSFLECASTRFKGSFPSILGVGSPELLVPIHLFFFGFLCIHCWLRSHTRRHPERRAGPPNCSGMASSSDPTHDTRGGPVHPRGPRWCRTASWVAVCCCVRLARDSPARLSDGRVCYTMQHHVNMHVCSTLSSSSNTSTQLS